MARRPYRHFRHSPNKRGHRLCPVKRISAACLVSGQARDSGKTPVRTKASPTKPFNELTGSVPVMEPLLLDAIRPQNVRTEQNEMKTKNALVKAVATDETIEQMLWDCLAEAPFIETQKVEQRVIADPNRPEI